MPERTAMAKIKRAVDFAGTETDVLGATAQVMAAIESLETETPQVVNVDLDVDCLRARIGAKG